MSQAADERIPVDFADGVFIHHLKRYYFALPFCIGKMVLDLGCGMGYGANLLAAVARGVVGMDLSADAISHCRRKYRQDNLTFVQGDGQALGLRSEGFEVVTSFEIIEHVTNTASYLAEMRRVLRSPGVAVLSTPNAILERLHLASASLSNPYHVNLLTPGEFHRALKAVFPEVALYSQQTRLRPWWRWLRNLDVGNVRLRVLSYRQRQALLKAASAAASTPDPVVQFERLTLEKVRLPATHASHSVAICRC